MTFALGAALLDALPDAVVALDADGRVIWWNETAHAIFGYSREQAIGQLLGDLIVPLDRMEQEARALQEAAAGKPMVYESVRRRIDGALLHISICTRAVFDGEGRLEYLLSSEKDVTRLKVARNANLLQSRFGDLLESTPDAIVIVDLSARIVLVNSHTERLFGYDRCELIGQTVEALVPERHRAGQLANRSLSLAHAGRPSTLAGAELHGLRKQGAEFPIEITSCPLQTEEGTMVMNAVRDITERKKAERKFRDLLESAPDAIVIVDSSGNIVIVNSQTETLFGYRRDELLGQPIETLIPERARAKHAQLRTDYFVGPKVRAMGLDLELYGRRKDGGEFPVEVSLSPLDTGEGQLVSSAIRDVTDRKKSEQKLREANRMKSEFLANMSHELRTPLNGIIGFSEFLYDEKPGPLNAKQKEYLNDILNSGRHLLQLINDVLDLSKVEAGRMDLFPEVFCLATVVDEACSALSPLAAAKQIQVRMIGFVAHEHVELDKQKLKQVLFNLLSNAVKFTPARGCVDVVKVSREDGLLQLEVRDDGVGIAPGEIGKLFVEFQQVDSSISRRHGGTGLGLALVKRIVELQRGTVGVASEPERGSTFTIVLPAELRATFPRGAS
jgi:PAS domain S-box-containing protein